MTAAFQWLNDIAQFLLRAVPRLFVVAPTHRAIRFGMGGSAKCLGPGIAWWWPVIHKVREVPVATQSLQIAPRSIECTHGNSILPRINMIGVSLQFTVSDPLRLATEVVDTANLIDNLCQATLERQPRRVGRRSV